MNRERRARLNALTPDLEEAKDLLEGLCAEEQEAYENLPEGIQESERGQDMRERVDALERAVDGLVDVLDGIEQAGAE